MPEILRHKRLRVVFTTEIHGYNLELLYSHCRTVAPSLLVVEAENGTVIGGFCSDPWQVKIRRFLYRVEGMERDGGLRGGGEVLLSS